MFGMSTYLLYVKTGKVPEVSLPDVDIKSQLSSIESLTSVVSNKLEINSSSDSQMLYKWTDDNGNVHYSTEPPSQQKTARKISVDPNVNVMKAFKPTKPPVGDLQNNGSASGNDIPGPTEKVTLTSAYNPKAVKKLIDDAKGVQSLVDERAKALEDASNFH